MSDPQTYASKDAKTADPFEHAVLTVLAQAGDHEDGANCAISVGTIAARAKMSDREARACLKKLLERGLIGLGDPACVAYIRGDNRPVVYDLLIPHSWYSPTQLARVNAWRRDRGRPELVADGCGPGCERTAKTAGPRCGHRPEIVDAPPRKRRSDLGTKRPPKRAPIDGGTDSPPVHGVTDSPPGLPNRHGGTTKSSDADESFQVGAGGPPSRGDYQSANRSYPEVLTISPAAVPTVTGEVNSVAAAGAADQDRNRRAEGDPLVDAVLAAAPHWSLTTLLDVLDDPDVRTRFRLNPEATQEAVMAVARGDYDTGRRTASPRRLLEAGPWWEHAFHGRTPAPPSTVPVQRSCGACVAGVVFVERWEEGDRRDVAQPCPTCHPAALAGAA